MTALRRDLLLPNPRGAVDRENLNDPEDMQPEADNHCNAGHFVRLKPYDATTDDGRSPPRTRSTAINRMASSVR